MEFRKILVLNRRWERFLLEKISRADLPWIKVERKRSAHKKALSVGKRANLWTQNESVSEIWALRRFASVRSKFDWHPRRVPITIAWFISSLDQTKANMIFCGF